MRSGARAGKVADPSVAVVKPVQVGAFATTIGQRAKTDAVDARLMAHFAEATRLQTRPLPSAEAQLLADLVARRRQIIEMIGAERQREKRAPTRLKKSIARLLEAVAKLTCVGTEAGEGRKPHHRDVPAGSCGAGAEGSVSRIQASSAAAASRERCKPSLERRHSTSSAVTAHSWWMR
jgi:transposase